MPDNPRYKLILLGWAEGQNRFDHPDDWGVMDTKCNHLSVVGPGPESRRECVSLITGLNDGTIHRHEYEFEKPEEFEQYPLIPEEEWPTDA